MRPGSLHHPVLLGSIRGARFKSLETLALMNPKDFVAGESSNLAEAWGVIYYCLNGGNPRYKKALDGYVEARARGESLDAAFAKSLGTLDQRRFESDLKKYMADELPKLLRGG